MANDSTRWMTPPHRLDVICVVSECARPTVSECTFVLPARIRNATSATRAHRHSAAVRDDVSVAVQYTTVHSFNRIVHSVYEHANSYCCLITALHCTAAVHSSALRCSLDITMRLHRSSRLHRQTFNTMHK